MLREVVLKPYIEKFRNYLEKNILEYFKDIESADVKFLERQMELYLIKMKSNYYMKSILYRESGQYIEDVYVDIPLQHFKEEFRCRDIMDIIKNGYSEDNTESKQIIISGIGGCGKSILMKKLFLDFIINNNSNQFFIPILIRLKSLKIKKENFFQDYILSYFSEINIAFDSELVKNFLNRGNIVLLLDGLDELKFNEKSIFVDELESFTKKYEKVSIVLSTRPETVSNMFPMFHEYKMLKMREDQVECYINKLPYQNNKKEILQRILHPAYYENHKELIGHPLILAILILTFDYNGEIPINTAHFYSTVYSTMLKTHDRDKETSFEREIKTNLSHSKLEQLFKTFCFITYIHEQFSFTRNEIDYYIDKAIELFNREHERKLEIDGFNFLCDIKDLLSFVIEEGSNYDFIHRSFQEFYTAKFILGLDDDAQMDFFYDDDNFIFVERGGVLDYLRMIDEKKYLYTGISPIIKQLLSDYASYPSTRAFILDNVDIIDFHYMEQNQYYVIYNDTKFSTAREELLGIKNNVIDFSNITDSKSIKNHYADHEINISEIAEIDYNKFSQLFENIIKCEIDYLQNWFSEYEKKRKNSSLNESFF